jgi:imidazolonepropionase-like amidohydrolase
MRYEIRLLKLLTTCALTVGASWALPAPAASQEGTTVLRAARILDGRGAVLSNRDIVIRDGRIAEIVPAGQGRGDKVHDLTGFTVLPGLIDTHVHLGWHFGEDGRLARGSEMPDRVLYGAENAHRMIVAGITTVQAARTCRWPEPSIVAYSPGRA